MWIVFKKDLIKINKDKRERSDLCFKDRWNYTWKWKKITRDVGEDKAIEEAIRIIEVKLNKINRWEVW